MKETLKNRSDRKKREIAVDFKSYKIKIETVVGFKSYKSNSQEIKEPLKDRSK